MGLGHQLPDAEPCWSLHRLGSDKLDPGSGSLLRSINSNRFLAMNLSSLCWSRGKRPTDPVVTQRSHSRAGPLQDPQRAAEGCSSQTRLFVLDLFCVSVLIQGRTTQSVRTGTSSGCLLCSAAPTGATQSFIYCSFIFNRTLRPQSSMFCSTKE